MTALTSALDITQVGTLYTIGYASQADRIRLDDLMQDERRLLIDIRYAPRSRFYPAFGRAALDGRYNVAEPSPMPASERRVRYVWSQSLGNRHDANGGPILLDTPALGIAQVVATLLEGRDVILLCACRDEARCHRLLVARLVQDALAIR